MSSEKNSPAMRTLSVVLPADMADEVAARAEEDRRSISSWLRIIIEQALQSAPRG